MRWYVPRPSYIVLGLPFSSHPLPNVVPVPGEDRDVHEHARAEPRPRRARRAVRVARRVHQGRGHSTLCLNFTPCIGEGGVVTKNVYNFTHQ